MCRQVRRKLQTANYLQRAKRCMFSVNCKTTDGRRTLGICCSEIITANTEIVLHLIMVMTLFQQTGIFSSVYELVLNIYLQGNWDNRSFILSTLNIVGVTNYILVRDILCQKGTFRRKVDIRFANIFTIRNSRKK